MFGRKDLVGGDEATGAADATVPIDDFRNKGEFVVGNVLSADNVRMSARIGGVLFCSKAGGTQHTQYDVFHE